MDRMQFKIIRETLGLSQADCAKFLGVGKRNIERWENGQENLPAKRYEQLAALWGEFQTSTDWQVRNISRMLEDQPLPLPLIVLVVYTNDADYHAVSWPSGELWPTSKTHRIQLAHVLARLYEQWPELEHVELVPFDRVDYFDWLGRREDTPAMRAHWAKEVFMAGLF